MDVNESNDVFLSVVADRVNFIESQPLMQQILEQVTGTLKM